MNKTDLKGPSGISNNQQDGFNERFSGMGRLVSAKALKVIRKTHVCVIGVGGVGVWAAEALARSGITKISLVDMDDLCYSNTNRQLHAIDGNYGKLKVDAMAERIRLINPECAVKALADFFTASSVDRVLTCDIDYVVDAIDSVKNKCLLLSECKKRGLPVVSTAGAGGRRDPTAVRLADLAKVFNDPLASLVRKKLRKDYQIVRDETTGFAIPCVFSTERPVFPQADGSVGYDRQPGNDYRLNCDNGFGTASYVTGAFGFAAASWVIESIASNCSA